LTATLRRELLFSAEWAVGSADAGSTSRRLTQKKKIPSQNWVSGWG